jgi:TP901 family phage tail tape measure protein
MAFGLLPPVTQVFGLDAAGFLAGIREMQAGLDEVAASITAIEERSAAIGGAGGVEGAGAAGETAAGEDALAEASAAAADAESRLTAAEQAAADMAKLEADLQKGLAGDLALVRDAAIAAADAQVAVRDAYVSVGEASAAAADGQRVVASAEADSAVAGDAAATGAVGFGGKMKLALLGVAAGAIYATDKAAGFNAEVTRLYTAAGLTGQQISKVSANLLQLGSRYGFTGTQMAEAMYHGVSAGLSYQAALNAVAQAANLADIHGADLEDTTYALSSVMKSFNIAAGGATHTAALLNAIVGEGDMRFQDFNQSVKNWAPTASSMGISIQSMGAAIAYLTDRGNSAEVASTRLTMGLSMVTAGSKEANTFLKSLGLTTGSVALKNKSLADVMNGYGLTTNKIAADLKKPDGLYVALSQLQAAFHHSGLSAAQADQVMAKLFGGGRSDKAILALMQNLGGLKSKYDDIGKAVNNYGADSKKAQETVDQQWKDALAGLKNLAISFGSMLLPAVKKALGALNDVFGAIMKHPDLAKVFGALVVTITAIAGVTKLWMLAQAGLDAALDANPIGAIIMLVVALAVGIYEAYKHCKTFRDIVDDVGHALKTAFSAAFHAAGAVVHWFNSTVIQWIKGEIAQFMSWWHAHWTEIHEVIQVVWTGIKTQITVTWDTIWAILKPALALLEGAWKATWALVSGIVTTVWHVIRDTIGTAIRAIEDVIGIVLDVITGHWGKAWKDIKDLAHTIVSGTVHMIDDLFGGLASTLYNTGKAIISGLWNGLKAAANAMIGWVSNVAGDISGAFKSVLGIFSPSRVFHQHGRMIMQGLLNGIQEGAPGVTAAVRQVAQGISTAGASHLAVSGGGLAYAGAGGAAGGTPVIQLEVYLDGRKLQNVVQKRTLRRERYNAGNGLNVQSGRS